MTRPAIASLDTCENADLNAMIDDIGTTHLLAMNYFGEAAYSTTDTSQQAAHDFGLFVYPIRGRYIALDLLHKLTGTTGQYNLKVEAYLVDADGPLLGSSTFVWGGGTIATATRRVTSFDMESIGVAGDLAGMDVLLKFFMWVGVAGGTLEISNVHIYTMENLPATDGSDLLW